MSSEASHNAGDGTHDRQSRNTTFRQFLISEARSGEGTHPQRIMFLWRSRIPRNRSRASHGSRPRMIRLGDRFD
jgi:hypothetical protein